MDWKTRSETTDDVVFFSYTHLESERSASEVFVWDLDKTYLDTSIDSLSGLFLTVVERAFTKRNIPGTHALIVSLAKRWIETHGQEQFPIYFITASPPQMEERILEKFSIDGLRPLGCFYKDNLRNLTPRRWWRLTKQVGYKLQALLQLRLRLNENVRQVFWGDDSESDAIIYNLYSDVCARRLSSSELRMVLRPLGVGGEQIDRILDLQTRVPEQDPVEKIYINLAVDTDPDYYLKFGRRTLPTSSAFQIALDLFQSRRLGLEEVYAVTQDMIYNYHFTPEELLRDFDDLVRRHVLGESAVAALMDSFLAKGLMPPGFRPSVPPAKEIRNDQGMVVEIEGHFEPWVRERVEYLHDYR